jgi:hypothetical protein
MLYPIITKIDHIKQGILFHQKYVEQLDALSLSSFTIVNKEGDGTITIEGELPILKGLERLYKDVFNIFDEGHIMSQSLHHEVKSEIKTDIHYRYTMIQTSSSGSAADDTLEKSPVYLSNKQQQHDLQIALIHKDLRNSLRSLHESVSSAIDQKLRVLKSLNQIIDFYEN